MKLFRQPLFIALGFLLLIKPGIITGMPIFSAVDSAIDILRLALIGFTILCLLFEHFKFDRIFQVVLLLLGFEAWKVATTLIAPQGALNFGLILNTVGILLFSYCAIKASPEAFFRGGSILFGSYIIINCLSVILFPGGIYATSTYTANYFLSYRTAWFPIYLTGIVFILLCHEYFPRVNSRLWVLITTGALFLSMILVWTVTGLLCFAVGVILMAVCFKKKRKPLSIKWIILSGVGLCFLILFFNAQEWFSFIIVDVFGKDVTLTQRTRIWENALDVIGTRLMFGHGYLTNDYLKELLDFGATHAHSYFLNTTLHFGVIGTAMGLFVVYWSHKDISRTKATRRARIITYAAMATLVTAFLAESLMTIGYYLIPLYIMGAYVGMETQHLDRQALSEEKK